MGAPQSPDSQHVDPYADELSPEPQPEVRTSQLVVDKVADTLDLVRPSVVYLGRLSAAFASSVGSQIDSLARKSVSAGVSALNSAALHVDAYLDGHELPPIGMDCSKGTDATSQATSSQSSPQTSNEPRMRFIPLQEIVIDYESNNHSKRRSYRQLSKPPRST